MNTRILRLIGYQLLNKANIGNYVMYDTACVLQKRNPVTLEPLTVSRSANNPDKPDLMLKGFEPSVDEIKVLVSNNTGIVETEVDTRAKLFLANYGNYDHIVDGLAFFNTTLADVNADVTSIIADKDTALTNTSASISFTDLAQHGKEFDHRTERVTRMVDPDMDLPLIEQRITTYQDLLNAIAFNLAGQSSATGMAEREDFPDRLGQVNRRIRTCEIFWDKYMPVTEETQGMKAVLDSVVAQVKSAKDNKAMLAISEYINTNIDQLPLVRRWWMYG